MEVWKPVKDYENKYYVSSLGNVKNIITNNILKQCHSRNNKYLSVGIFHTRDKVKCVPVHILIGQSFLEKNNDNDIIDHIDKNKYNNNIDNLRYTSLSNNSKNTKINIRNKSGTKGVYYDKLKDVWIASYNDLNKVRHRKIFKSQEEAILFRQEIETPNSYL